MPRKSKEKISLETVKHVARLARLDLTDKELKNFQKDLDDVLLAFKDLDKAKTR
jgi:aspartyl/glutamyl-tRNA(Asn/Gln) amidotransferase C subunit